MMTSRLRVGLLYNLKKHVEAPPGAPADALAEYDSDETVNAIEGALRAAGHDVVRLEADRTLVDAVRRARPDICFNLAEGLGGEARESLVPGLLEMLGVPYTGSRVLAQAISLDKGFTKHIWRDCGLPTAPFQAFRHWEEPLSEGLDFPLFVKPVREGSGMGIDGGSKVTREAELRERVRWVIETYKQPALAEGFLPGREYTVGLIGNGPSSYARSRFDVYGEDGYHVFPVLEIDSTVGVGNGVYNSAAKSYLPGAQGAPDYICPADISAELVAELRCLTIAAFDAIGALDVARIDFRMGADGRPYLIEINTLPGLNPVVSDLCIVASAEGFSYGDLINEIMGLAIARYSNASA